MQDFGLVDLVHIVALRKESVDRNNGDHGHINGEEQVALRKESVDRNALYEHCKAILRGGRSPQGERG